MRDRKRFAGRLVAMLACASLVGACFGDGVDPDPSPRGTAPDTVPGAPAVPDGSYESCAEAVGGRNFAGRSARYSWSLTDEVWQEFDEYRGRANQQPWSDREADRGGDGVNAIFRPDIGTITFGTEDADPDDPAPEDDPLAMIIIELGGQLGVSDFEDGCPFSVASATFSTTDARAGTALEINGRKFVSLPGPGETGTVYVTGTGGGLVQGAAYLVLTEEFISPIEAPRYEGFFSLWVGFTATIG